ncbi:hypothetical protein BDV59DRAFT_187725 [Aspergillus ambiguus]|uniref:uncharacterized protein n=1 Tax=Aspergillus ambiguus TaxID=176160 RepID=UPI003CCD5ACE
MMPTYAFYSSYAFFSPAPFVYCLDLFFSSTVLGRTDPRPTRPHRRLGLDFPAGPEV